MALPLALALRLVLDNNITLRERVTVNSGGTLIMNKGATITSNREFEGGIMVNASGTFTMRGGTISGNTVRSRNGGGVHVAENGTFTMSNGTISGNTNAHGDGGGVSVNGAFTMRGGTISGNTAPSSGGGVWVAANKTFTKTGGTITGYTGDTANGNVVRDSSGAVQNYRGHAVYAGNPSSLILPV